MKRIIRNRGIIIYFILIALLLITSNSTAINIKINSEDMKITNLYITLFIIGIFYCLIRMVKKIIIFEENEIIITRNILGIKIKRKRYRYDTIVKFIVGKFNDEKNKTQEYHMYIDQGNNIIEIISCSSYKECMDIIKQIKQKTNKLIYDGTDNNCFSEEDLFRNYYKLKNTLDEIKGEN